MTGITSFALPWLNSGAGASDAAQGTCPEPRRSTRHANKPRHPRRCVACGPRLRHTAYAPPTVRHVEPGSRTGGYHQANRIGRDSLIFTNFALFASFAWGKAPEDRVGNSAYLGTAGETGRFSSAPSASGRSAAGALHHRRPVVEQLLRAVRVVALRPQVRHRVRRVGQHQRPAAALLDDPHAIGGVQLQV